MANWSLMPSGAWRVLLVSMSGVTAALAVATILALTGMGGRPPWTGLHGYFPSPVSFGIELAGVIADGPANRAGLRAADVLDFRYNSLLERYWLTDRPRNGKPIAAFARRGGMLEKHVIVPTPFVELWTNVRELRQYGALLNVFEGPLLAVWLVIFAGVIAWRRFDSPQLRLLSLSLVVIAYVTAFRSNASGIGWSTAWPYVAQDLYQDLAGPGALALWIALSSGFGQPLSMFRRILMYLSYVMAAALAGINLASTVGLVTLWYDWNLPLFTGSFTYLNFLIIPAAALLCTILAINASRGEERQRSVWVLAPIALLLVLPTVEVGLLSLAPSFQLFQWRVALNTAVGITYAILFAAPAALTYAALKRRLIDLGFVLNRSVVVAIVSLIVIVTFVGLEWAAGNWLTGMTRTSSTILGLFIALLLGVSLRYIHAGVDRFVDHVFFWKRHADEAALRRFAHEASYITDRSTLLDRALQEIRQHTSAEASSILLPNGSGAYSTSASENGRRIAVSENDPGIVALRAWHRPVELHEIADSSLSGELAFPMVSRGQLVGVLICGAKRDGEAYAPDEFEALIAVAHGVGGALDMLDRTETNSLEALREAIVSSQAVLRSIADSQEALLAELRKSRSEPREEPRFETA